MRRLSARQRWFDGATPSAQRLLAWAACGVIFSVCTGPVGAQTTLLQFIDSAETEAAAKEAEISPLPAAQRAPLLDEAIAAEEAVEPLAATPLADSAVTYDSIRGFDAAPYGAGFEDESDQMPSNMPVSWISGPYLRTGVTMVMGDGLLEGGQKTSWGINGGFRQPLSPGLAPPNMFFDLGGGYLSALGNTNHIVAGRQTTILGVVSTVNNAFSVNLTEVKRASVQAALGWYWGDPIDYRSQDPQLRFATRLGGRVGSVRGRFLETRLIQPPAGGTLDTTYLNTDTFGGLFVGTEAILLERSYSTCNIQWTADAELANDWIEFGGFDSGSLGTASLMMGFMLSR